MNVSNIDSLVRRLEGLYDERERAPLAHLRQAVYDPTGDARVFGAIGHFLPRDLSRRDTDACLITATLFAFYIQPFVAARDRPRFEDEPDGPDERPPWQRPSIGASGRLLREALARDGKAGAESLDQRMTALINSHEDDLPERLRHLIHRLRSGRIPLDFRRLLWDLQRWRHDPRAVRRDWAEAYWQPQLEDEAT